MTSTSCRTATPPAALWTRSRCTLDSEKDVVNQLVHALLSKPKRSELTSPFPKGTTLLSARLKDGVLTLNFSKEYGDLTGAKRTLANGAVVLTMTQLKQVDSVVILAVGESVLPGKSEEPLTAEDFDLSGMSADPIPLKTTLYFPSEDGTQVLHETRTLQAATTNQTSAIQAVLRRPVRRPRTEGRCRLSACHIGRSDHPAGKNGLCALPARPVDAGAAGRKRQSKSGRLGAVRLTDPTGWGESGILLE